MEILFEILFDLIIEGSVELSKSKRVPLPIRIILGTLVSLLFIAVIALIGFVGVSMFSENVLGGIFCLGIDVLFAFLIIRRGMKEFRRRRV
ncbi:MAG TPA: hypothetical protein DEG74_03620 [Clostridiales bacterium]|nr:hypothetical protein [Clostridiales bacterium]